MIICTKCNKELGDEARFCDNCGAQVFETIYCPNCGQKASKEFSFCQNCGELLSEETTLPQREKGKKRKRVFRIIGSFVVIVLIFGALIGFNKVYRGRDKNINHALYIKNGEITYTDITKINPWQVTTNFSSVYEEGSQENAVIKSMGDYALFNYARFSNDGRLLFYIDEKTKNAPEGVLFYRYVNAPEKEPVKIDSGVTRFVINDSGKLVTYLKGDEKILYQYNLEEKEKIDSDVLDFYVSSDGQKIIYIDGEGRLYCKIAEKEKEKIDSEVTKICHIDDSFSTIHYVKEDNLYKRKDGESEEKIATEVEQVLQVYESGEIYYTKKHLLQDPLMTFVEDDMLEIDNKISVPIYPSAPKYSNYETYDEYRLAFAQYQAAKKEYAKQEKEYDAKAQRNELREKLKETTTLFDASTLYYYDGEKEKQITDNFGWDNFKVATNTPVITYYTYDTFADTKIKLSEIKDVSDVSNALRVKRYSFAEEYVAVKGETFVIEEEEVTELCVTSDGDAVYFIADVDETNHGDLYKAIVSGGVLQKPTLYDEDVYLNSFNGVLLYYKDALDGAADLYVKGEEIDTNVKIYQTKYLEDFDTIIYMVDWNQEKEYGVLKMHKDGKTITISEDVHDYETTEGGDILYLCDYSKTYVKGDLLLYKDGESQRIDDEVVAIIPTKLKM